MKMVRIIEIHFLVKKYIKLSGWISSITFYLFRMPISVQEGISTVTRILCARSFCYIFCQSIKLIPDIYEVFACKPFHYEIGECPYKATQFINMLIHIGHLFLVFNSCVNILLYIMFGKHFRNSLIQVII